MTVREVLTRPVAWKGRVALWMVLAGVLAFGWNQWTRLRSEIDAGAVLLGGKSYVTRPVKLEQEPRIARQEVRRASIEQAVVVRPLLLSDRQREALERRFEVDFSEPGQPKTEVIFSGKAPPAPRGADVLVTVTPEGKPEVIVKAKPPAFLELGPWVADFSVVQELADSSVRFGRVAISKDLRLGKVTTFGRASYDFGGEVGGQLEGGIRVRF